MSGDAHLSSYRLMWIFVMFDLPVGTKQQSREATKFREFLLDQGFEMSQFSVYARFCNGRESYDSHLRRIERNLPEKGEIHVLTFTDKQYESIVRFSSQRRKRPRKNPDQLALSDVAGDLYQPGCGLFPLASKGMQPHPV